MKNLLIILSFLTMIGNAMAKKEKELKAPFIGSWKFTNQTVVNDFQKVKQYKLQNQYESEYFIFESNHSFRHEFLNKAGIVVKTMKGKWKSIGDKIKIEYSDIDFSLSIAYFFLDKDLVLGQNFSHVIFTKEEFGSRNLVVK